MTRKLLPRAALALGFAFALAFAFAGTGCTGGGGGEEPRGFLSAPQLVAPTDGTTGLDGADLRLRWEDPLPLPSAAAAFDIQIAADAAFAAIEEQALGLAGNEYRPAGLAPGRGYFWRVRAHAGGTASPWSFPKRFRTAAATAPATPERPVIYQLVVRHFGNTTGANRPDGDLATNGCGRFADVDAEALRRLREMGITHVWLTGVLQQATLTDWSAVGQPADDPDIVKGRAGSFYAIKDAYDVSPDYATDPARRLEEMRALIERIHQAGLRCLIDFVPNHVARSYASDQRPQGEPDLGAQDDQARFFAKDNAFFYLQADPGRALALTSPFHWRPAGLDGGFAREDGGAGRKPRVTGNDDTSYTPAESSWYETVKLNYGYHFADPAASDFGTAQSRPATWLRMRRMLQHWVDLGVDGFRCDFAHLVPDEAWRFLIGEVRAHAAAQGGRDLYFLAEAYDRLPGLLGAGFDAVYDDATYDRLKEIYQGSASVGDLDALLRGVSDQDRARFARYLENHDERRIASPLVVGQGPDASGFGSAERGRHLAPLAYLAGNGPILVYNGQEVGEDGAGAEGFGGDDGRTTIFDYWRLPALSAWANGHRYDGGQLRADQRALRAYYRRALTLANHPYARGGRYYGLNGANPGLGDALAFARYATDGGGVLVVVTNFALTPLATALRIPLEVGDLGHAALAQTVTVRRILDPQGSDAPLAESSTRQVLAQQGFPLSLPAGSSAVFVID